MMRVLIDTNCLESDELRLFLDGDQRNLAVLPEHTITEIFKPRSNDAIFASLSVLAEHPRQVLILGSNRQAGKVNPRAAAISNHFVDKASTRAFPRFCGALEQMKQGHRGLLRQLEKRRAWADERAKSAQTAFGDQSDSLADLAASFPAHELNRLRSGQPLSARSRATILEIVRRLTDQVHDGRPDQPLRPQQPPHLYYDFTWRYVLCHVLQLMDLVRKGAVRRAPEKARNDHFDNVLATFGTYFNGVMTNDSGPLLTQHIARIVLRSLGARLAVDYVESEYILSLLDATPSNTATTSRERKLPRRRSAAGSPVSRPDSR